MVSIFCRYGALYVCAHDILNNNLLVVCPMICSNVDWTLRYVFIAWTVVFVYNNVSKDKV